MRIRYDGGDIGNILQYIEKNWKLQVPRLILSVLNSNLQDKENEDFYIEGLVKVAIDTGIEYRKSLFSII